MMKKFVFALAFLAATLLAVSSWGEMQMAPAHNVSSRTSGEWVGPHSGGGDITLGEEWITYYSGVGNWIWWGGPERASFIVPPDFPNSVYPFWIKKVRGRFYELSTRPWGTCTTFTFKLYGDDGFTLLHESDTLIPLDRSGAFPTEWDLGTDSVEITFGNFYLAVAPVCDSHPSSYTDPTFQGHTVWGVPGAWAPFTFGELSHEAYVHWGELANDVSVMAITRPTSAVWVDTSYEVRANVRNNGTGIESFDVEFLITSAPDTEYIDTASVSSLNPGSVTSVLFQSWTPALYDQNYTLCATTLLGTDQNPNNDELCMDATTYEYGEIAYDNFTAEAFYVVNIPNGAQDAFGLRAVPYFPPNFVVTKFKIYTNSAQPFDNVRLCPDAAGSPDFNNPYDEISAPGASSPPEWIEVNFDTNATRMTSGNPIWLCAQFSNGADGPGVGTDQDMPLDLKCSYTVDLSTWMTFGFGDLMMRIVHIPSTGVAEGPHTRAGLSTRLYQNSPNPFRGATSIQYSVSLPADASLKVYDVSGRLVKTLESGTMEAGIHKVTWDGKDDVGANVGSGVYFCKLSAPGKNLTRKMVILP